MNSRVADRQTFLPSLSAAPAAALTLGSTACETRQKGMPARSMKTFRSTVWKYWGEEGRHTLPWRKTKDPYRILVSEVMLQQTQVPRVVVKYAEFLKAFPTVRHLAKASLADVLRVWSGMGYNRRGKFLREAAKIIVEKYRGNIREALRDTLPGVGTYTRGAVLVFAFNESEILIETNIRTVFIHHFYSNVLPVPRSIGARGQKTAIEDARILPLIQEAGKGQDPRTWHWALMDYGAHIKKLHGNPARKSAMYVRQSKFEGSLRQVRGAILRELHAGPSSLSRLSFPKKRIQNALTTLKRDGLIERKAKAWAVAR